jgi:hypothetical protein
MSDSPDALLWGLLGYLVLPLWLLAGVSDYLCHLRSDIARTSGTHESALHLLQTVEIGIPMLALLFLRIDALTLSLMIAGVAAHTHTSWRDVRYAAPLRYISPFEQYVHAFLIVLPLLALAIVLILHWPALLAMTDPTGADWSLQLRQPMFDAGVITAILAAATIFGVLPGIAEFVHALRAARRGSAFKQ